MSTDIAILLVVGVVVVGVMMRPPAPAAKPKDTIGAKVGRVVDTGIAFGGAVSGAYVAAKELLD